VGDSGNPEKLVMYPMQTLGSAGATAPAVVLTGAALPRPRALAFDDAGNLWFANGGTTGAIVQIAASSLLATGAPVALAAITSPSMQAPETLAFDGEGNLRVASSGNNSVLKFNKACPIGKRA